MNKNFLKLIQLTGDTMNEIARNKDNDILTNQSFNNETKSKITAKKKKPGSKKKFIKGKSS